MFQEFQIVSGIDGIEGIEGIDGFETSSLNPFSVEKGLVNERF